MIERPIKVLLIEDDRGDVRLVEKLLAAATGAVFELQVVSRLGEGLKRLAADGIDVILLDLTLPDSEAAQTFKKIYTPARHLPVLILTGREDEAMALRAVRDGAQDYLAKRRLTADLLGRSILYSIERKRFEEALRESEERYALAVSGANDGLWDWNLKTDEIYFSPRWKGMLGHGETELQSSPNEWLDRVHPEDLERFRRALGAHLDARVEHFENEHRMRHKDGSFRWMLSRGIAVRDALGSPYRFAGSLTDIHQRKIAEDRLRHDALSDGLTSLPNWVLFKDRLRASIARGRRRRDCQFAVLFLDLDRFKNVNDSLGHAVGDQLLIGIARRLEPILRPGDTLARLGGDEFAVLIDDSGDPSNAKRVAERIHEELKTPFKLDGHDVFVTVSIGIALSSTRYHSPEDCLRDADTAMYRAKAAGGAAHTIFDWKMHQRAVELLQLETDLRRAVERGEFHLHYQPVVSLSNGAIEGFEALVRWQHPERGMLYPDEFIPLAEETGLIIPLGWSVLREACRQMVAWQTRHPTLHLFVSVNFSGKQFMQPDLIQQVERILLETGVVAESLRLELTETMIMQNADSGVDKLARLADLNLQLYIDDFGTGYSSLSYLHRLPTHALKIDRSFVSQVAVGDGRPEIVGTIVALARKLGMRVEAEGIETEGQLAQLRELGCEFGQGYYFSKPLDSTATGALIASRC